MTTRCPCCKTSKPVVVLKPESYRPTWMADAKEYCMKCGGWMNGTMLELQPFLQWGKNMVYWPEKRR